MAADVALPGEAAAVEEAVEEAVAVAMTVAPVPTPAPLRPADPSGRVVLPNADLTSFFYGL